MITIPIVFLAIPLAVVVFLSILYSGRLKGYRTMVWNGLLAIIGAIAPAAGDIMGYAGQVDWTMILGPHYAPIAVAFITVTNAILRKHTTGPVGQ